MKLKPALYTKIKEGAIAKDVSINVWVKAIFLDFTKVVPGLTDESGEKIKEVVKNRHED